MNVLVVTTDFPPLSGGISRLTHHVVHHLAGRGHAVRVITPHVEAVASPSSGTSPAFTTIRTPGYHWGVARGLPMFGAVLRERRPDVLLAMNLGYGGLMSWTLQRLGGSIPYAVFAYGFEFAKHERRPLVRGLYRGVLGRADRVFAVSHPIRDRLLRFAGLEPGRVEVVWPGVDHARFAGGCRENVLRERLGLGSRRVLLSLSRLVPRKGHDVVLRALPRIADAVPDVAWLVAGDGPERGRLQSLAAELGVAPRVFWLGELSDADVALAYAACDVFVLPCREIAGEGHVEGFGIVFLEAGAAGRPVIAGNSGGVPDAVAAGESGLLVDPTSPEALAEAVVELLADPQRARRMGEAGRKRAAREFAWPTVLAPLDQFVRQMAACP